MFVSLPRPQADAVLGAMRAIALEHGDGAVTDADRTAIASAATIVLGLPDADVDALAVRTPQEVAAAMLGPEDAAQAVRLLAVMSLVDGSVDAAKTAHVAAYAAELGVEEDYLTILAEVARDEVASAAACIMRKNVDSFPRLDHTKVDAGAVAAFFPYRDGHEDPELAAGYEALGALPEGTFGRAFFEHFKRNGFAFPGHADALAEGFTTPHDTSHVLSGYSTSQAGEICVSTFIAAMHPDPPMSAEVLPVLYSWHVGVQITPVAGRFEGAFEPRRFWTAWDRGSATTVDVVDEAWDFWAVTGAGLDELRAEYGVPGIDPALLA
jgi:hypothetical protein